MQSPVRRGPTVLPPQTRPHDDRVPRKVRRWALTGVLATGVILGSALLWRGLTPGPGPGAPLPAVTFDRRADLSPARSGAAASAAVTPERDLPTYGRLRLGIPSLGVDAPVVPEPIGRGGELVIPGDPGTVGRWESGPDLDATVGTTVFAGHVSVSGVGDGALRDLHRIEPGELVITTTAGGALQRWRVDALLVRHKDDLPSFAAGGPRQLAIVTCGGPLLPDGASLRYRDNVIAYAAPAAN